MFFVLINMVYKNTIKYFLVVGGIKKICKAIIFYAYDNIKRKNLDLSQERVISIFDNKLKTISQDKGISSELIIHKIHEPLTTSLIIKKLTKGMHCIDIGSNIGYYAILESSKIGDNGLVWSIEPSPQNFKTLSKNIILNQRKNIKCYNIAIGEKNGKIDFLISEKSNWSKIKNESDHIEKGDKIIQVDIMTLDSFSEKNEIKKVDLLRMDVEGYERNIIEGSMNFLEKFKPILMIEVHKMIIGNNRTNELLEKLQKMNYECEYFIPRVFDVPIIGDLNDIKNKSIEELLRINKKYGLPDTFQLVLYHKNNI